MHRIPKFVWRLLKLPVRILYALGLGAIPGNFVLLLTTIGRKSGLPRVTPLQYSEVGGNFYVGSARGVKGDWYRNILANSSVEVQLKSRRFHGVAKPVLDPEQIADFLEDRMKQRPRMMAAILQLEGYPPRPNREQLIEYAKQRALIVIYPMAEY